jgi:MFS family permease
MASVESAVGSASVYVRDRVTWLGYAALAYLLFLESSLGPAMPSLRDDLGMSYTIASLHFTAVAGGAVLAAWMGDRVARKLGRARSFWAGCAGMTLGGLLIVASPSAIGTIAGAAMVGMLGALLSIVVQASLADRHGSLRATAMAEVNLAGTGGAVLAAVAVGLFERVGLGWRGAVMIVIAMALAIGFSLRSAEFPTGIPPAAGRRAAARRLPGLFWACCILSTLSAAIEWGVAFWGADFLNQEIGLSKSGAAISMACFFVAMAVGRMFGGRLARAHDSFNLLVWTFVVAAIGFPIFWLAGSPALSLAGLMLMGLGIANVYPFIAAIAIGLVPGQADVAIARLIFTGSMAVLAAPFALGVLGDLLGIKAAFGIVVPISIAALALVLGMRRAQSMPAARREIGASV